MRLMIVDDEKFPLDCLANNIPWSEYGIQVVATKVNVRDALNSIPETMPDLIITDVCMPEMDGIELLKGVRARYPDIDTIIISGYEEFDYVKDAINLGAKNYILKPIVPGELLDAAIRIRDERLAKMKKAVSESTYADYLKSRIFSLYTPEQDAEAEERFRKAGRSCYIVLTALFENMSEMLDGNTESVYFLLNNFIRNYCIRNSGCFVVEQNPHNITLLFEGEDPEKLAREVREMCVLLESRLRKHSFQMYTIGIGETVTSEDELCRAYLSSVMAANLRYIYGYGNVYCDGEHIEIEAEDVFLNQTADALNHAVMRNDENAIARAIEAVSNGIIENKYDTKSIQSFARITITKLLEQLGCYEVHLEEIYPMPGNIITAICTCSNRQELLRHLMIFLRSVTTHINRNNHENGESHITQIKQYIEANYADSQLSSSVIAKKMHFNSAYISTLFSNSTGVTLTNYINQVRIQNAVRLLTGTDEKIGSIAKKTGFESRSYFCTVLKNITGKSPSEYRTEGGR